MANTGLADVWENWPVFSIITPKIIEFSIFSFKSIFLSSGEIVVIYEVFSVKEKEIEVNYLDICV